MRIYLIFDLINVNNMQSLCMLILLIQLWQQKLDIVLFLSSLILKKWIICRNFVADISQAFSICGKEKLGFVKIVLVPIKVVRVKNYGFLHPNFELHRCHQMNKFLCWCSLYWNNIGTYISHELIVRLIPTWIWNDLLSESQIWPSHHELSHFF